MDVDALLPFCDSESQRKLVTAIIKTGTVTKAAQTIGITSAQQEDSLLG